MSISDFKGKWLILFFYPADFTFVCPTELEEMADNYEKFKKEGAEVVSVSTDTVFAHKAWHDMSDSIKKLNSQWHLTQIINFQNCSECL